MGARYRSYIVVGLTLLLWAGLSVPLLCAEGEGFKYKTDVFGFDPNEMLDHKIDSASRIVSYGSWGTDRFFLICNPRLKQVEYLEEYVVGEKGVFSSLGRSSTDLYQILSEEMKVFGDILSIRSRDTLQDCINSLTSEEGTFYVLAVDVSRIRRLENRDRLEATFNFKVFALSFVSDSSNPAMRDKLGRCEFLYGDSVRQEAELGGDTLAAFTSCLVKAVQTKLVHSLVARVLGNKESLWNPELRLFKIPAPGPSISFYLNYEEWNRLQGDVWRADHKDRPIVDGEAYLRLKYDLN